MIPVLMIALLLFGGARAGSETKTEPDAKTIQVVDVNGAKVRPMEGKNRKATVFFFIARDCPISNRYTPEINALCADYTPKKVTFYVVYVEPDISAEAAKQHAKEYGYRCAALLDPTRALVKRLKAKVTPETVLLAPDGKTLYQGRIDNRYVDFGKERHRPSARDLRQALDETLAGKRVTTPRTTAIGCFIPGVK